MSTGPALKFIPPRVPFLDQRTGLISREWYLFLQGIFIRTGSEEGVSSETVNILLDNLTAIFRPTNTAQIEQLLREISISLQAAQRPQRDLTKRLEEIEARFAAIERRISTDELRLGLDEIRTISLAG